MKSATTMLFGFLACCVLLGPLSRPTSAEPNEMFLTRSTAKAPEAVVEAVKAYADAKKWQYLGANKVKQGEVTLVKICIPEVGKQIWPVGLHLSAMLPCGNLGVYQKGGARRSHCCTPAICRCCIPIRPSKKPARSPNPC